MNDKTGFVMRNKKGLFLSSMYTWSKIAYAFPWWHLVYVFEEIMNYKDKPTEMGQVDNHESFNLDIIQWEALPS